MFYYPTTSDLAMYGSSSYGNKAHIHSSRPKSKNRNTAGKKKQKLVTEGFGFLHADLQLHSERFIAYFFSHINPKVVEGLETMYKPLLINSLGFKYLSTGFNLLFLY